MKLSIIKIEIPVPCDVMGCTERVAYSIGNSIFSMPGQRWNICKTCYESLKDTVNVKSGADEMDVGTSNLSEMSRQDLFAMAKEKGVKASATMSTAALIEELEKC